MPVETFGQSSILADQQGRASGALWDPSALGLDSVAIAAGNAARSVEVVTEGFRHFQVYVERDDPTVPMIVDVEVSPSRYQVFNPVYWPAQTIGQWPAGNGQEMFYFGVGSYKESTIEDVPISNPGAGIDWTYTVPAGRTLRLVQLRNQLVTNAVVANRNVRWLIQNEAGVFRGFWGISQYTQTANQTVTYSVGPYGLDWAALVNGFLKVGTPGDITLHGGWNIQVFTSGLQAGDAWQTINMIVERIDHDDLTMAASQRLRFAPLLRLRLRNVGSDPLADVSATLFAMD